jgi:predicted aldo/keto reductase-like oxidoreductase
MAHSTRRDFIKTAAGVGLAAGLGGSALATTGKRTATDWVTLGRSNVQVTRLAFGTGSLSGAVQRNLGQDGFTRLVRYAYDRGIRFFETAENYHGMPEMLATALKGLPRDSYRLMTKYGTPPYGPPPAEKIDLYRRTLNSEYIDILLLHCLRPPTWEQDYRPLQDAMSEAKSKKIILSHGASVHGLPALRTFPGNQWLDIAMIRMNHNGVHMDTEQLRDTNDIGNVDEVVKHTKAVHEQGMGVISMKLVGEGSYVDFAERDRAMKFAMNLGCVDCVTLGFKNNAEIDEAIDRMARVMA